MGPFSWAARTTSRQGSVEPGGCLVVCPRALASASTVSIESPTLCTLDRLIGCVSNPPRGISRTSYAERRIDVNQALYFASPGGGAGRPGGTLYDRRCPDSRRVAAIWPGARVCAA